MSNMVVRTNVFALNAHRNMKNVGLEQGRASNRLASGYRINSAADDAAGLAISESMRAQIRGLDQASRNAQDGQALIQTAEGGMNEIQNMFQRIRELAVQAANDTNTPGNREHIQLEVTQLLQEIDSMANRVEFNGMRLLSGDFSEAAISGVPLLVADNDGWWRPGMGSPAVIPPDGTAPTPNDVTPLAVKTLDQAAAAVKAGNITANAAHAAWLAANLSEFVTKVDVAGANTFVLNDLNGNVVWSGTAAQFLLLESDDSTDHGRVVGQMMQRLMSMGGFREVETGDELVLGGRGDELFFQVGANSMQYITVGINAMDAGAIFGRAEEIKGGAGALVTSVKAETGLLFEIGKDSTTADDISAMIDYIQAALDDVSTQRARLGAVSNRLDYTMRSLDISSENLSDAESRVRNADMAREMMRFTMSNVLQQASVSMLAQANQLPNNLLQLLR